MTFVDCTVTTLRPSLSGASVSSASDTDVAEAVALIVDVSDVVEAVGLRAASTEVSCATSGIFCMSVVVVVLTLVTVAVDMLVVVTETVCMVRASGPSCG